MKHQPFLRFVSSAALALAACVMCATPAYSQQTITYLNGEDKIDGITLEAETALYIASGQATQSGDIYGAYSIIKTGEGTLTLDSSASYIDGPVIIEEGALTLGNSYALPNQNVVINSGTLNLNGHSVYLDTLNGSGGAIHFGSNASLHISEGGNYAGAITSQGESYLLNRSTAPLELSGSLNISGAFYAMAGRAILSGNATINDILFYGGDFEVAGGSTTVSTYVVLSTAEGAELKVSGGGKLTILEDLSPGYYNGESGTVIVTGSGSHLDVKDQVEVSYSGTGIIQLTQGGKLTAAKGTVNLADRSNGNGTLVIGGLSGEAAQAPGLLEASTVTTNHGTGTLLFNHTSASHSFENNGTGIQITGSTRVAHENGVTLFSRQNSYTGGTTISGGTLLIAYTGSGSALGSGSVEIGIDGTLAGIGRISGHATVAGILSPGNSPGALTFADGLTLQASARVKMEIGGSELTEFDRIIINGSTVLNGVLLLSFTNDFIPEVGETFQLFTFSNLPGGAFSDIIFTDPSFSGSFDHATGLLTIVAIPEPSHWVLLGLGGLSLLALRITRRDHTFRADPFSTTGSL